MTYTLFNSDAFEWLSQQQPCSIQAVVTDPPFGVLEYTSEQIEKQRSGTGGIWRLPQSYDGYKRKPAPRFTILRPVEHVIIRKFHAKLAQSLYPILVPGAHVIVASHTLLAHLAVEGFTDARFELRGQIARIVKTLRGGDRPKGSAGEYRSVSVSPRACWEPWLVFRKPCDSRVSENLLKWGAGALRRPADAVPFADLISAGPARGRERTVAPHPSLKPQGLMRQIVRASLPLGKGVVLDPFMGSGSTIAAAEFIGVESIGVEIDSVYFRMAETAIPQLARLENGGQP